MDRLKIREHVHDVRAQGAPVVAITDLNVKPQVKDPQALLDAHREEIEKVMLDAAVDKLKQLAENPPWR